MAPNVTSESPRLRRLFRDLAIGTDGALDAFWREVVAAGTPLIEPISGDDRHMLVTFVWRPGRELSNVVVSCPLEHLVQDNRLARLEGTDLWYKTFRVDTDVRTPDWFSPDDTLLPYYDERDWAARSRDWVADPLNPYRVPEFPPASVLVMPDAPPQPWSAARPGVPAGEIREHVVPSAILGGERTVWVYTPPAQTAVTGPSHLLLLFDGSAYRTMLPTPTILDNLLAARRLAPLGAVFVHHPDRWRDLDLAPDFVDFLAEELLPWLRREYEVRAEAARTVVGGSSLGGLAAAFAALRRPDLFGTVLSQSGAFYRQRAGDPDCMWLPRYVAVSPRVPVRFALSAGRLETWPTTDGHAPSLLSGNRRMRDALRAKGYEVQYREFAGGHDYHCWEGVLPEQLLALIGDGAD